MEKIIGLPVALRQEAFSIFGSRGWSSAGPFLSKVERVGDRVFWAVVTGPGRDRAQEGVRFLLECGAEAVINLGVAGALTEGVGAGRLYCPSVIESLAGSIGIPASLAESLHGLLCSAGLNVGRGSLFTSTDIVCTVEGKRELHRAYGADIVDTEAFFMAETCRNAGTAFASLKAVSDTADQSIPALTGRFVRQDGATNLPAVMVTLLTRPWLIPKLFEMKKGFEKATYSLELARSVVVADLRIEG